MTSRAIHDLPFGPGPAASPPWHALAGTGDAERLAEALAPGLHAAFDGCLSEGLPMELADRLAALLGRLDRPTPPRTSSSVRRVP
jgi:hypothetical protein